MCFVVIHEFLENGSPFLFYRNALEVCRAEMPKVEY